MEMLNLFRSAIAANNRERLADLLEEVQAFDQARLLLDLTTDERQVIYGLLGPEMLADILQELDYDEQLPVVEELGVKRFTQVLNEMSSDDAADLLGSFKETLAEKYLGMMRREDADDVRELLAYPEETAGGLMTTEYVAIKKASTVKETIESLRLIAPDAETIYYIYVTNNKNQLAGVLSLRDLIVAGPGETIGSIMSEKVVSVPVTMDQEEVAAVIDKYDFLAVPVINDDNVLLGIVTVDDVLDVLKEEATEDIGQLSAIRKIDELEVSAFQSAKRRLPWLILLLFVDLLSGNIISFFEVTLNQLVILAAFIPLITDMAGNTGTQSLAVVVRGLALGEFTREDVWGIVKREAGTGLLIGTVCGLLVAAIAFVWQGNPYLGLVIGFSLWATLITATLAGAVIPLIINTFRIDPAVASGPFITTINDIVGLIIYFSTATFFMSKLI
ncbi:magnesium transporter [Metallumcola ferriviriculae]|uniref:Magnesium transporter MgtE n=1 Tax=Metallumcola ferriviriculae TaxID=3039180 RepID=A0AAU0UI76_9FIRM|nr:magnesium transporter [Desulfitibacteraceae bacterium MK1]